jgi:hypothetical protein
MTRRPLRTSSERATRARRPQRCVGEARFDHRLRANDVGRHRGITQLVRPGPAFTSREASRRCRPRTSHARSAGARDIGASQDATQTNRQPGDCPPGGPNATTERPQVRPSRPRRSRLASPPARPRDFGRPSKAQPPGHALGWPLQTSLPCEGRRKGAVERRSPANTKHVSGQGNQPSRIPAPEVITVQCDRGVWRPSRLRRACACFPSQLTVASAGAPPAPKTRHASGRHS